MTAFKEIRIGAYVLRFWPSDNGWMCGITPEMMDAIEQAEKQAPLKLWLWKNFVDGKPEYWAFDNPFPCMSVGGDPLTLGEPCGWAFLKPSVNGRPHCSEQEVINTVTRLASTPQPQREWVGLTWDDQTECLKAGINNGWKGVMFVTEAKLKDKNGGNT